jgi:hypothetical protein
MWVLARRQARLTRAVPGRADSSRPSNGASSSWGSGRVRTDASKTKKVRLQRSSCSDEIPASTRHTDKTARRGQTREVQGNDAGPGTVRNPAGWASSHGRLLDRQRHPGPVFAEVQQGSIWKGVAILCDPQVRMMPALAREVVECKPDLVIARHAVSAIRRRQRRRDAEVRAGA